MCCVPRSASCSQCVRCAVCPVCMCDANSLTTRKDRVLQGRGRRVGGLWAGDLSAPERNSTIKIYNNGQWLRCCCPSAALLLPSCCRCHDSCRYCLITPKWPRHAVGHSDTIIKGEFKCGSRKCWLLISPFAIITTFFGQFNWSLISMRRQPAA